MQAIPRWRNLLNLKGAVFQSTTITWKSNYYLADFHSTSIVHEKWKAKWNPDSRGQQPSKDYARYKVRQKRADMKKALRNLLRNGGSIHNVFQAERDTVWTLDQGDHMGKKDQSKSSSAASRAAKAQHRRMKRRNRSERIDETDDLENVFRASFGKRWSTWTYGSAKDFSYESRTEFNWKEQPKGNYRQQQESDNESESESYSSSCVNNMSSERKALGLPSNGPLKIEEIKSAFRLSAFKWHPDKHQGPSQAVAEEKFKYCVDAYKSLCSSVSNA